MNTSKEKRYHLIRFDQLPSSAADLPEQQQRELLHKLSEHADENGFDSHKAYSVDPITWYQELGCILFFLFLPGGMLLIPMTLGFLMYFDMRLFWLVFLFSISTLLLPAHFWPECTRATLAEWLIKYFSFKGIWEVELNRSKPYILVAPPHGVFPFGNLLTMFIWPRLTQTYIKGLGASVVFKVPLFKHICTWIGAIDASWENAYENLLRGPIGISPGGIAEIYEVNNPDEVIVLKNRKGMIRLAFQTGSPLVPCYIFGNSDTLDVFYDKGGKMQKLCRTLRFAFAPFWGRFYLPIPYRIPITGVIGSPIEVPKKEKPTDEEINEVHQKLLDKITQLFDTHKKAYGWEYKKLIIV